MPADRQRQVGLRHAMPVIADDDFIDPAVTALAAHMDSIVVLSRSMAAQGMYPAVDPIASSSIMLDPLVVGQAHVDTAIEVRRSIEHYRSLQDVISLLGVEELGVDDRVSGSGH